MVGMVAVPRHLMKRTGNEHRLSPAAEDQMVDKLLGTLSRRYETTLTATALRMIELSPKPAAIVTLSNNRVRWSWRNDSMKQTGFWQERGLRKPDNVFDYNEDDQPIDSRLWLDDHKADQWELYQSYLSMPYYNQTLFMLRAESREGEEDYLDDVEDAVDQFPDWGKK